MVSKDGIISAEWNAPLEIFETKVEDSALLPFSDIQSIFEKMMAIYFEPEANETKSLKCSIDEVHLELQRVVEQNSIETVCWSRLELLRKRVRVYSGKTQEMGEQLLLCVNAVDGSVIDLGKGY